MLQKLIKSISVITFFGSVIAVIAMAIELESSFSTVLLGIVLSFAGSLFLYGFGDIIESLREIADNTRHEAPTPPPAAAEPQVGKKPSVTPPDDEETKDDKNDYRDFLCPHCGETVSFLRSQKHAACPYCDREIHLP